MQHAPSSAPPLIKHDTLIPIGVGGSAAVYGIDEATVLKRYYDEFDESIAVERLAYDRLGTHCNIVRRLGEPDEKSFLLERGEPLSLLIRARGTRCAKPAESVDVDQRLIWIRDAAEGLRHIHSKGLVHADVACTNMVSVQGRVKIIDFGGCSIDGSEAITGYNWYNKRSLVSPNVESDIFAFGCAVYEILTGKPPHHRLEDVAERGELVRRLYAEKQFPEVEGLPLRELMLACWHGSLGSMDEVIRYLEEPLVVHEPPHRTESIMSRLMDRSRGCFSLIGFRSRPCVLNPHRTEASLSRWTDRFWGCIRVTGLKSRPYVLRENSHKSRSILSSWFDRIKGCFRYTYTGLSRPWDMFFRPRIVVTDDAHSTAC